jgi:putative ABC transport system permease protein
VWRLGIGLPGGSRPGDDFVADTNIVAPGYFATLGIPVRAGRDFDARDRAESQRVVIVDEQAARHYWPGQSALGRQLSQFRGADVPPYVLEVVGVVGDVKSISLIDGMSQSFVYVPFQQAYDSRITIVTRSASTRSLATDVRRAIASMDASVAVTPATTLDDSVAFGLVSQRVAASVTGSLGTFGLALAAVGLYAITSLTIVRRLREFGIRLALGAPRRQIVGLILRQALGLVLLGCVIGAVPAVGLAHVFGVFLVGLPATQPVVIGGAAVLFLAVGLLACIGPALTASLVSPLAILRS